MKILAQRPTRIFAVAIVLLITKTFIVKYNDRKIETNPASIIIVTPIKKEEESMKHNYFRRERERRGGGGGEGGQKGNNTKQCRTAIRRA